MKSYIEKQNILGFFLIFASVSNKIINASQKQENCNSYSAQTNIEKEFDRLVNCALSNSTRDWRRTECEKYFLPLSNDKASHIEIIEATDFSTTGQYVTGEFIKNNNNMTEWQIFDYIRKTHSQHKIRTIFELVKKLEDQVPGKKSYLYNNQILKHAYMNNFNNFYHSDIYNSVTDQQDRSNITETIVRHKRQTQS